MSTADQNETLKPETETTFQNAPPTTTNKPKIDDDPKAKTKPQVVTRTSPVDAVSHTTSINSTKKEDAKALSKDSAAGAGAESQLQPPSEDQHTSPTKNGDSAADSQVQPVINESTSKDSSPAGQSISTHKPETDEGPHPPVQEISPAYDEPTPKELSPRKSDSSPLQAKINDPAKSSKKDSTKKSISEKFKDFFHWGKGDASTKKVEEPKKVGEAKEVEKQLKKLQKSLIEADVKHITKREKELVRYNKELKETLELACKYFDDLKNQGEQVKLEDLQGLRKEMMKLKLQDPSKYKFDEDGNDQLKNLWLRIKAKQDTIPSEVLSKMPQLHKSGVFETSVEFKDFEARYSELGDKRLKLCLLCFSAFPQGIIRKRLMLQWWVSEGYASHEKEAHAYFTQLIDKGFIEPVIQNGSRYVGCCRMHPFYRSALVILAERAKFFNFGAKGEPTQNFKDSFQSCLVGPGLISFKDIKEEILDKENLEQLHLLINVDEHILEFKPEWFSKMANLNILYLGRWKVLPTDHIEVEDTEFFSGFKTMSFVKFLSLQGISNITDLPKSILQMENLEILDVRACYNLETIPEGIECLKNLMHLDMSECCLLDHMPKGLSSLRMLKVIKGFVVGADETSCTLDDLATLPKLGKLCIYTGSLEFPEEHHVEALEKFKNLCKLTITWGGNVLPAETDDEPDIGNQKDASTAEEKEDPQGSSTSPTHKLPPKLMKLDHQKDSSTSKNNTKEKQEPQGSSTSPTRKLPPKPMKLDLKCFPKKRKQEPQGSSICPKAKLPQNLMKLDLKCFPKSTTPYWLELRNLQNLKKLYIRGGRLSDLGQYQDVDDCNILQPVKKETWKVEVLRLKYLSEIKMEWKQLHKLFPCLEYLEKVSCPNLTFFPGEENWVWIKKIKSEESISN